MENRKERYLLAVLGVDGMIVSKWILKEKVESTCIRLNRLRTGKIGFMYTLIKCEEFIV